MRIHSKRDPISPEKGGLEESRNNLNIEKKITDLTTNVSDFFSIQDSDLLFGDLFALTLTAQLLGFTDAVLDPTFIPNGGFSAPIPLIPSTLGIFLTRLSIMDIAWILASLKSRGYNVEAFADEMSAIKCTLTIWLDHCSIRISIALLTAFGTHTYVDGIDLLRQVWFTLPIMISFRIIYCLRQTGKL